MMDKHHKLARERVEREIKRKLSIFECVHHIDCNPSNNRINNLRVMTRGEHASLHHAGRRKNPVKLSRWSN